MLQGMAGLVTSTHFYTFLEAGHWQNKAWQALPLQATSIDRLALANPLGGNLPMLVCP